LRLEINPAGAALSVFRRFAAAGGRARQFGGVDQPSGGHRETHDLDRGDRVAVPETAGVLGVEGGDESLPIGVGEVGKPPPPPPPPLRGGGPPAKPPLRGRWGGPKKAKHPPPPPRASSLF